MNKQEYMPSEVYTLPDSKVAMAMMNVEDSRQIFDDNEISYTQIGGRSFVNWGQDNQLPFDIMDKIGADEVMSQNKFFNVLTCYGAGLKYMDAETGKPCQLPEQKRFFTRNMMPMFFLEQATDMKYFFFSVAVLILSADGKQINRIVHKEACYCRFEKADKNGRINHIGYGNWRNGAPKASELEVIPLLDMNDPFTDLMSRMGREPGSDGITHPMGKDRKFAMVMRFPTPGFQYYPMPYYTAILRGDWYDIKHLIGVGKKAKLRNHASIKYQVEVHKDYWDNLCMDEGITDAVKKKERIKKERENIRDFVAGIENSGKVWITGYYIDPNGKEVRMVRVNTIEAGKEGGDWSEDIQEASNITCYGDNIHPNLVGATPGKSQSNNSGSDKRELFTLKQSLEIAFHDIMNIPHQLIIEYNGWSDKVYPDVPMILLTTLDKNTDAQMKTANPNDNNNGDNN